MIQEGDKQPKPITVEAFRFVQLKAPRLYTGKHDSANFITHPSPLKSLILQSYIQDDVNIKSQPKKAKRSDAGKQKVVKSAEFVSYTKLSEIRELNKALYSFIFWLKDNRGKFQEETLARHTAKLQPLKAEERIEVWENLFYQTQTESTSTLVEALVCLLQADHFLTYYRALMKELEGSDTFPIEQLQKAAKANIIIPHELFDSTEITTQDQPMKLDAQSKAILSDQLDIAILNHKIVLRTKAVEEIRAAENFYTYEHQQEYEKALNDYEAKVNELQQAVEEVSNSVGSVNICGKEIEPFGFKPENTWDDTYLKKHISEDSLKVFQSIKTEQQPHITDTRQAIERSIGDLNSKKYRLLRKHSSKTLIHNGIQIPLRNRPLNNAYVFKAVPIEGKKDYYSIYATQYFENSATKAYKISATVSTSEGKQNNVTQTPVFETDQYTTLQLFSEGIFLPEEKANFNVNGTFETEDSAYSNQFDYQNVKPNLPSSHTAAPKDPPNPNIPVPKLFGIMGVKIAEFKKVNQTLCCYTEGEVSHIENILAREYKERETRNLIRSELTTEQTRERESENLTDTSSSERHEMQSEISILLQEDQSNSASASASAGGFYNFGTTGGINFNINGSLSTSSSSSSSSNFSESESYAKEITQRAMKRIVEKTTYKRTSKMIREFEDKNKHGFDNREGDKHVTGVYRWVDKIYRNDLVNYGKRLMYEFVLPEPAKNYKHLLISNLQKDQMDGCNTTVLEKPLSPEDKGILRYWDITEHNFDDLVAYYGLEIDEYPERFLKIARSFSENFYQTGSQAGDDKPLHAAKDFEFEIPKDYVCIGFDCRFKVIRHGKNESLFGDLIVGSSSYPFDNENVHVFKRGPLPITTIISIGPWPPQTITIPAFDPVEEYLPIAIAAEDVGGLAMTVTAECEIKSDAFDEFRANFFAAMWVSYKEMNQAYEDAVYEACLRKQQDAAANQGDDKPNYNMPSATARAVEKREIKRLIIEQIMQKYYATLGISNFPIGANYYQQDPCNNTLNLTTSNSFLSNQLKYARFLEQAFEWEIMAYTFLPYYWSDENDWGNLLSIDAATDHIFLAFLKAGMVDVVLPVKPGLEKSVAFLLETGKLWRSDGFILDGQDDLYPAIEENLQIEVDAQGNEIEYDDAGNSIPKVEASWETRVPSTLTIVQDHSNPLAGQGLPCFCEKDKTNVIGYSSTEEYNILSGKKD